MILGMLKMSNPQHQERVDVGAEIVLSDVNAQKIHADFKTMIQEIEDAQDL